MRIAVNSWSVKSALALLLATATAAGDSDPLGAKAVAPLSTVVSDKAVLEKATAESLTVRIDLERGVLLLLSGEQVAIKSPISAGRRSNPTDTGKFTVSGKRETVKGENFGRIVDGGGHTIASIAYTDLDPVPPGCHFEAAEKPYVIDLGDSGIMIHAGVLAPVPCSDGAIIVPEPVARLLFERLPVGCPVEIVSEKD